MSKRQQNIETTDPSHQEAPTKKLCTLEKKISIQSSSSSSPILQSTNEDLDSLGPTTSTKKLTKKSHNLLLEKAKYVLENYYKFDFTTIKISPSLITFDSDRISIFKFTQKINTDLKNQYEIIFIKSDTPQQNFYLQNLKSLLENLETDLNSLQISHNYLPKPDTHSISDKYFTTIDLQQQKNIQYTVLLKQASSQQIDYKTEGKTLAHLQQASQNYFLPGLNQEIQTSLSNRQQISHTKIPPSNTQSLDLQQTKEQVYEQTHDNEILIPQLSEFYNLQYDTYIHPNLHNLKKSLVFNNRLQNNCYSIESVSQGYSLENIINHILSIYLSNPNTNIKEQQQNINSFLQGYNSIIQLNEQEISFIFYMLASRVVTEITLDNEFSNQCRNILKQLIQINPNFVENQLRIACNLTQLYDPNQEPDYTEFIKNRKTNLLKNMPIFFTKSHPVKIIKGAFQYLYDDHGRTFVDCANNVQHVGHNHPRVVKAGCDQLTQFNCNTRFLNPNIVNYAKNIQKTAFPDKLNVSLFCNSGSEANDMALYISRLISDSQDVIVMDHSYHGTTTAVTEISVTKFMGKGGMGKKDYIHITPMPDEYRGLYSYDDPQAGEKYAQHVKDIIDNLKKQGRKPAAFICESMPAVGGMTTLPKNYLKKVYEYIREAGGVCIADEVQVGFGRVEGKWWAYELQDVTPDMVIIGKPMGNGHPVAGIVMTQEIADKFNNGQPYFNTYGGNPVSMKIANEVLDTIVQEKMRENADMVGQYLFKELQKLQQKHEIIGSVRGSGLFIGIELVKDKKSKLPATQEAERISNCLKNHGFIMLHEGHMYNVLKIKPALTFSLQNSRDLVKCIDNIISNKLY